MKIPKGVILNQNYEIQQQVGGGGGGNVYEAFDQNLQKRVAIKHLLLDGLTAIKAFKREAQLLANLDHPCLPRVLDHFEHDLGQFLVMDYIDGDDLSQRLEAQNGPLEVQQVLTWADQLLDLLDYLQTAHATPIIHRDIKPANIKITPRGQLKLIDFGLAKSAMSTQVNSVLKSIHGYTQTYAPPEQIYQTGTDERSDLFALGATLYHLLTGRPPSDGNNKTIDALIRDAAVIQSKPDPIVAPMLLNPAIPEPISQAIMRAMALKKEERFASAAEFRQALKQPSQSSTSGSLKSLLGTMSKAITTPIKAVTTNHANSQSVGISPAAISQPLRLPAQATAATTRLKRWSSLMLVVLIGLVGGSWWWVKVQPNSAQADDPQANSRPALILNSESAEEPSATAGLSVAQPTITLGQATATVAQAIATDTAVPITAVVAQPTARPATARPATQPTQRPTVQPTNPPPPSDRDGDGVADANDPCPDTNGPNNGCPAPTAVPDRDGDGVVDPNDPCPDVAGPNNGCPVVEPTAIADRDGDTIPDDRDACPNEPGDPSRNGCPKPADPPTDRPTNTPQPTAQPTVKPNDEVPTNTPKPITDRFTPTPTPKPTARPIAPSP